MNAEVRAALAELAAADLAEREAGRDAWPYRPDPAYRRRSVRAMSRWQWACLAASRLAVPEPPP